MSTVLDLIEAKGEKKGEAKGDAKARTFCYINCRIRNMSIKDAQGISGLSDELVEDAEKQYQKKARKQQ